VTAAANPVLIVIRYLGRIAVVLSAGLLLLTWRVLDLAGKAGSVDPTAVAAVAAVGSALTFVLGALGAMLVSTKIGPTPEEMAAQLAELEPTQVQVVNEPTDPVPTEATKTKK
jgi:hypothetical protein